MAVVIDTVSGTLGTGASVSQNITVAANSNRCLVALVANDDTKTFSLSYSAGSGGTWTKLGSFTVGGNREFEIWYSTAPSTGSVTVVATPNSLASLDLVIVLYSLYGVDQTTPMDGYASDNTAATLSITSGANDLAVVLEVVVSGGAISVGTQDFAAGANDLWRAGHNTGSPTATVAWSGTSGGINGANVRAVAAGGGDSTFLLGQGCM